MKHTKVQVDYKFGVSHRSEFDFVIATYENRMNALKVVQSKPGVQNALKLELQKIEKTHFENKTPKAISVAYEGRGGITVLVLGAEPTSFTLQTAMRKAFGSTFEESRKTNASINVYLNDVSNAMAVKLVNWMMSLAVLFRFQPKVFGVKEKEAKLKSTNSLTLYFETALDKNVFQSAAFEGRVLGLANNQVRFLSDLPSNVLNPKSFREIAKDLAKEFGFEFKYFDDKALKKRGAGAFLAVTQADSHEECGIVHLRYRGTSKSKSKKKIAIVGKGLCFDTGGYNMKGGESMLQMHRDMTGSAVALSLIQAFAETKVPFEVNIYLALAENLVSHKGYKPSDVVIASNGLSIEVIDTDAEGRMVLSDTLVLASESFPDLIIDFATLTHSIVRAIDTFRSGVYSNDKDLYALALKAGDESGERVLGFPIGEDYDESLLSNVADLRQCARSNYADHIYGATFLSRFVGENIPWLHVDLGASGSEGGLGLVPTKETGFGVRFGFELIQKAIKI